ncbi:saccharopine dehydrogenase C-terminal domain-containing protein [Peribacillus simplex]|uniref:saccharopine dehydrogenase family protein n=1 Tax=Peribacillus TaxID=2675229 RepID=UPI00177B3DE0|nr:saccharopine dehydrogenase C-terminal domain-containing protein [Brevibacillus sp. JNUCC-41]QOS89840.1 saccharopine dehydrogenase NADP-binding domain-containing protein [Brevibacillus sp. JNUCC-41]
MKIIVIGGAGIQALGTIYDLLENDEVTEVMIADILIEKAEERAKQIGDPRLTAKQINVLNEEETANVIKGFDVIINSGPAFLCPNVTRAALKAGVNYVDLGAWPKETAEQLELTEEFEANGITAVLGMGSGPGISNMMALAGVEQLDTVSDIDITIAMKDFTEYSSPLVTPYMLDTIIDEYTINPVVVKDGEITKIDPLISRPVEFKEPIGLANPIYTIHPEPVTLYDSFKDQGCKNTTFSIALPKEFHEKVEFLVQLGFGSKEPINMGGAEVSPRQALLTVANQLIQPKVDKDQYSVTRVDVTGEKNGRKEKVVVEVYVGSEKKWNIPAGALKTSVPPSIVAQMLAKGQVKRKGVYPPEKCIETAAFFKELALRGMEVYSNKVEHTL